MSDNLKVCFPETTHKGMKVAVICDHVDVCRQVTQQLQRLGVEDVAVFTQVVPFFSYVDRHPKTVILLLQTGPYGVELALNVRDRAAEAPLIWFSDLDFAVTAFRLRASYFGLLPVTEKSLRIALERVEEEVA